MNCGLTHAPGSAARAEATAFATEGYQALKVTRFAPSTQESMSQDPTTEVLIELLDHEIRQGIASVLLDLGPKREPVVLDDFVEKGLFGLVPVVGVLFDCGI
jgi:hypothetical protein